MGDYLFEFDAPKTIANLIEMANTNDDGADQFFDILAQKMQVAKSGPNLGIIVKQGSVNNSEEYLDENKENFAPDQFDDHHINAFAHQLIRSAKKKRSVPKQ